MLEGKKTGQTVPEKGIFFSSILEYSFQRAVSVNRSPRAVSSKVTSLERLRMARGH